MFASGKLRKLIALGLRGMTSNPSIFEMAIDGGRDYDAQIEPLIGKVTDPNPIFEALAIEDIRAARAAFAALARAGISLDDVTEALSVAGVASFASAYERMLDAINR